MNTTIDVLAVMDCAAETLVRMKGAGANPRLVNVQRDALIEARAAVAELIRCDLDYDDVTDGARWRDLPDDRVCDLACRYCGDDAATRERITAAVKAARMHAIARVRGGAA